MRHKWGDEEILDEQGGPISGNHKKTCTFCGCVKTEEANAGVHETQYRLGSSITRLAPLCDQRLKND